MLESADIRNVKITGGIFRERMNINRDYLMELDSTCLLQNFYLEAGIIMPGLQVIEDPQKAKLHWGWEAPTCQLRGHFLGHWMSAASRYVAFDDDAELKCKLDKIVDELKRCQELNGGGWIGSIPEKYMYRLAGSEYIWSPQYTMHKTVMGLRDAYVYTGNEKALEILNSLALWYLNWVDEMNKINPNAVYSGEQGGMLELFADLYERTKDDRYLRLTNAYKDNEFFKKLLNGEDALTDYHANASIPLAHGAARLYEVMGDEKMLEALRLFWKSAVSERGMHVTTGQNAGEFWIPPYKQGEYLSDRVQEVCTVYNMVRCADYLYRFTGESKYADYIERAIYNGFLAQQNPNNGMPTYFLPLRTGSKKKWGSKRHDFWCCHGTMVQSPTLYPQLIYYTDVQNNQIKIAQYIPSDANLSIKGDRISISQETEMSDNNNQVFFEESSNGGKSRWNIKFKVECEKKCELTLSFRIPAWSFEAPLVILDGKTLENPDIKDGYVNIKKIWGNNTISLIFKSTVYTEALPDMPSLRAFLDGPIVLAGLTSYDTGLSGNPTDILYPRTERTYSTYPWSLDRYVTVNQSPNVEFIPLYEVCDEEYTVYFTVNEAGE